LVFCDRISVTPGVATNLNRPRAQNFCCFAELQSRVSLVYRSLRSLRKGHAIAIPPSE
jgi:hypothetical protein